MTLVRKCSETVVGVEIFDGLSTGLHNAGSLFQAPRYGDHIQSIRFKEYYGMHKGDEHDPIYSVSSFSGQFFLKFS